MLYGHLRILSFLALLCYPCHRCIARRPRLRLSYDCVQRFYMTFIPSEAKPPQAGCYSPQTTRDMLYSDWNSFRTVTSF
eukprot:4463488-Amphidinium_carterae.1